MLLALKERSAGQGVLTLKPVVQQGRRKLVFFELDDLLGRYGLRTVGRSNSGNNRRFERDSTRVQRATVDRLPLTWPPWSKSGSACGLYCSDAGMRSHDTASVR